MYEIFDVRTYEVVYTTTVYAVAWIIVARNPWLAMYE